jgi:Leucine-rich repeat (LRR) protein
MGGGVYSSPVSFAVIPPTTDYWQGLLHGLEAGDFDGDGHQDLVVGHAVYEGGNVSVLLGDGSGGFAAPTRFLASNGTAQDMRVADLNGDGLLDIVATSDDPAGVSVLLNTTPPPTTPEVVTFPDANLEAVIRQWIHKPTGDIYPSDLEALTSLNAENLGIADLTGLEYCVNLQWLWLKGNPISDISPLAGLTNLRVLWLEGNQISDVSALAGLINLEQLWLDSNQISDISVLAGLTSLQRLGLMNNRVIDISALAGLINLEQLWLDSNQIIDISVLAGLTNLQYLGLSSNQISDISVVAGLINLRWLGLGSNQVSNISALAGLTNLWILDLGSNQVSDISPLVANAGLSSGDIIDLQRNRLSADSRNIYIPELQARGVAVYYSPNNSPAQPSNVSPTDGASGVSLTPTLQSSDFSDFLDFYTYGGDTHAASRWQITATPGDYSSPVFDSDTDTSNLTSITIPSGILDYATTYYWHVQYLDSGGAWSEWSAETSFTTEGALAVTFPDPNLEAAIRAAIDKPTGDIYPSDLEALTALNASGKGIADLTGLEYCTNLLNLDLGGNLYISDISVLGDLTNLQTLDLHANQISDVSALTGLTNLWNLGLGSNQISDISALADLTNMKYLGLDSNQISDISPLVANVGIGGGDEIYLQGNPLSADSRDIYIPQLQARGVTVFYDAIAAGDANGDGTIDALDITSVERVIARLDALTAGADANQDGKINALDITKIERRIAGLD